MHETHLIEHLIKYLDQEEVSAGRKIKGIHIALSEFGGISQEHFSRHYQESTVGTKWQDLEVALTRVPYGPELEITKIVYA